MAKLKFYYYSRCNTCRNAKKYLDQKDIHYELIDISERSPSQSDLKKVLKACDGDIRRLFNTSGQLYRSMNVKELIKSEGEKDLLKLLSSNGMLVKRPVLVGADVALVGFKEAEWKASGL